MQNQNKVPQQENDPQKNPNFEGTNQTNDRPKTPDDGFSDHGNIADDLDDEKQEITNAEEREIPELNPSRNDVEGQEPAGFDIDESNT